MARRGRFHRPERAGGTLAQPPWRRVTSPLKPVEVLTEEQIERIHEASLDVLEETGIEVLSDAAWDVLARGGVDLDPETRRARFDRGLVVEAIARAPAQFTLHARNPARDLVVGGNHINFCTVSSAAYCSDLDRGRRRGTLDDFRDFIRLAHSLNTMHLIMGYPVEPQDIPPESRHLDCYHAFITLTDKVWRPYALSRDRLTDALAMIGIVMGMSREELAERPALFTNISTNSPLRLDGPMGDGIVEMARARQPLCVAAFALSGAMAPITLAGTLVQQNAEVLAGLALAQMTNPGTPVIYGSFAPNVDMRSGAPTFGTPEYVKAALAGGQLARRYGLPYRSNGGTASNAPDAQSVYETEMSLWAAVMGHANLIFQGAGWLEGGLTASFEKMILDTEMVQMLIETLVPIPFEDDDLALDAIAEVGPGGHFFGTTHTLARYETAFYEPLVSDWRNFETWEEDGSRSATERANTIWKRLLADYEPPPLDPAIKDAIDDYVAKRKREIAA